MSLRLSELAQVVDELRAALGGALVQKAWVPLPRLAYLELRVPGRSLLLCACAEGELARLSVAEARFPTPGEPAPFQKWLRQELVGLKLAGASLHAAERCLVLDFAREGEQGRRLVLDLGAPGGLLLLNDAGRVLMLSGEGLGPRRGLHPGATWALPEPMPPEQLARALAQPSRLAPREPTEPHATPLAEAAEGLVGPRDRAARAESIRRRLALPHRARLKRLTRTLDKVRAEAGRAPDAERHKETGELLAQNLWQLERGQKEVRLTRYTADGAEDVVVRLDPARGPKQEVDWHFHQYRRLLRGVEQASHRLKELEREEAQARTALGQLEAMDEDALLAQAEVLGAPEAEVGPGASGRPFKEYLGHGGQRIWVGRGAEANDALTFKTARPWHLWLHARGVPGSHVVLPLEKGQEPKQEALLDAAHLALHHSGLKGEPRGEVSWVPVKFVRKVKGGAPGQVLYTREKTFVVRVEPERLERLLKAQVGAQA